jgi:hypothetical protein
MLMALASHLAPRARVRLSRGPSEGIRALIDSAPSAVDDGPVLERAGWVRALNDEHDPYMTDPRVSTVRYERLRPFHPSRSPLLSTRSTPGASVFCCDRRASPDRDPPGILARWNQVGSAMWIDPQDAGAEAALTAQDIALTGLDLITGAVMATLDEALLTDAELEAGAGLGGFSRSPPRLAGLAEDPPARPVGVIRIRMPRHPRIVRWPRRVSPLPSGARTS